MYQYNHRTDILRNLGSPPPSPVGSIRAECGSRADHNLSAFILYTHTILLLPKRGGGLQTSFLQTKALATAVGSPNGSNEDETMACLVFLVYLFAEYNPCLYLYILKCVLRSCPVFLVYMWVYIVQCVLSACLVYMCTCISPRFSFIVNYFPWKKNKVGRMQKLFAEDK